MTQPWSEEVAANSVERLLRSTLFVGTDRSLVERCASSFALWRIGVGTTIVLDGEVERTIHVIRSGTVRLELRGPRGEQLVAGHLREGEAFGVESLLGERPHATFAVCMQPTVLLSASAAALAPEFHSCAGLAANVAAIVVRELDGIALALQGLRYAGLATRVSAVLERLAGDYGIAVASGTLLDVALEADDLAALTRCSPEDAAAVLFFLERNGRIRKNGSLITLLS